jgi:hypothetical protein
MLLKRCFLLTIATGILFVAANVYGDEILANLPGTSSGTGTNLGLGTDLTDRTKGVGLTMGGTSMIFDSMVALISNGGTDDSALSGGIFDDVGGNPGTLLAAFAPVNVPMGTGATEIGITTVSSFSLLANTSYWFVLDGPAVSNSLLWNSLNPNVAPTAAVGLTYNGYRFSSNGGGTWGASSIFNGVRINASAIPEPRSGLLMIVMGLGMLLVRSRF